MEIINNLWSFKPFMQLVLGTFSLLIPPFLKCLKRIKERDIIKSFITAEVIREPIRQTLYGNDYDEYVDISYKLPRFDFQEELFLISLRPLIVLSAINFIYHVNIFSGIFTMIIFFIFVIHELYFGEKYSRCKFYKIIISIFWLTNYIVYSYGENGFIK